MTHKDLLDRIASKDATVAVLGLGYVGLPLCLAFAEEGFHVIGLDIDARRVDALTKGKSYVDDVADGALEAQLKRGKFEPTKS